ncbi:transposase [Citromicrobium bathyomarinum]
MRLQGRGTDDRGLAQGQRVAGRPGCDADWFRDALAERGIAARIPSKANRRVPILQDPVLYRQRHRIENMFGKLKDRRRIHTRYDRSAHTFISAICIAAAVIFWLNQ